MAEISGENQVIVMVPDYLKNKNMDGTKMPRGKPVSGRKYKTVREQRHSALLKDKPMSTSWDAKMKRKAEKKSIQAMVQEIKSAREEQSKEKKRRQQLKRERIEQKTRKAEVVQKIKNPAKIKRMRKKQLRKIEQRKE